ncbi:hypothetical protein [Sphingomonas sp. HMP6]|uniref:hypothetical protein n=1 Tax=Sphingomonas sp. HMP6 TaxID=1517551 RepID=UPI0015969752|nr:hypothetical protein [Sphingomonas sp. HMP6]
MTRVTRRAHQQSIGGGAIAHRQTDRGLELDLRSSPAIVPVVRIDSSRAALL